jgi:ubiquitin conjugation factor E4 A
VGPKKKNLKVKDFGEFDFKPQELVSHISQIYVNLADREEFCRAVSQDGRSYSQQLFGQAVAVLQKIHWPMEKIVRFEQCAEVIKVSMRRSFRQGRANTMRRLK